MNIKLLKKKDGFTLIELMIVVFIIGLISTISVLSYTSYRRAVLLDFAADNFVAQINEIRGKTILGDFGSDGGDKVRDALSKDSSVNGGSADSKCFGLLFMKNGDKFDVFSFTQSFDGSKVYRPIVKDWQYEGCGNGLPERNDANYLSRVPLEMDEDVVIVKISTLSNNQSNEINGATILRFLPPKGDFASADHNDIQKMRFVFAYGVSGEAKTKTVEYDLISLNATVLDEKND